MTNHCGTCTACCRVFEIPEFKKPAGKWCEHCEIGVGCKVYDVRPERCADFSCFWLLSQSRENPRDRMPLEMRPDKSKVVISPTTNENVMAFTNMPGAPFAHQRPDVMRLIGLLTSGGMAVVVGQPRSLRRTLFDKNGSHEVRLTEPDADGMQFNIQEEQ